MKKRDLAILNDLQRFRCMTRDDIIDLHFKKLKHPITCCNTVLKRLRRDGYIDVSTNRQPYLYFNSPAPIKKDSAKIPHFLEIVDFYKQLLKYEPPKIFIVEPKYGKQFMEPDAFMIWRRGVFFVEIQRSVYSKKVMDEKYNRYMTYWLSEEWKNELWQPTDKKIFPPVLLLTDTRYDFPSHPSVRFFQIQSLQQFIAMTTASKVNKQGISHKYEDPNKTGVIIK